jgi:polysaccharide deacetylase 2 family uncharacterized protein YibQ
VAKKDFKPPFKVPKKIELLPDDEKDRFNSIRSIPWFPALTIFLFIVFLIFLYSNRAWFKTPGTDTKIKKPKKISEKVRKNGERGKTTGHGPSVKTDRAPGFKKWIKTITSLNDRDKKIGAQNLKSPLQLDSVLNYFTNLYSLSLKKTKKSGGRHSTILVPHGIPVMDLYLKLSRLLGNNRFVILKSYELKKFKGVTIHVAESDSTSSIKVTMKYSDKLPPRDALIAMVFLNLGSELNPSINGLLQNKTPLTLGIIAGQPFSREICRKALANGHEVILQIPMESKTYPYKTPGLLTIMLHHTTLQIRTMFESMKRGMNGYSGYACYRGSRLLQDRDIISKILNEIHAKKYYYLDNTLKAPHVIKDVADSLKMPCLKVDADLGGSPAKVLESQVVWAKKTGSAVISARPGKAHFAVLKSFSSYSGIQWVPVSRIIRLKGML